MASELRCYQCGESLTALSLPLVRADQCPQCSVYLHACRMCRHFDPAVAKQCREDDAEEVKDKRNANFCDWFDPSDSAFDPDRAAGSRRAEQALAALFGDAEAPEPEPDAARKAADDLFR